MIGRDVVEQIHRIKRGTGPEIQMHGSSVLLQALIRNNLVDQYHLWSFPVVLGRGKRLFGEGAVPAGLRLIDSQAASTGVIVSTYVPAGPIQLGTFAP